jgi:hypothetical protein
VGMTWFLVRLPLEIIFPPPALMRDSNIFREMDFFWYMAAVVPLKLLGVGESWGELALLPATFLLQGTVLGAVTWVAVHLWRRIGRKRNPGAKQGAAR